MANDRESLLARARDALRRPAPGEAVELLCPWVQRHPEDAGGWGLLGVAYFKLEDWSHAETAARNLVRLRPSSAKAWCNLGTILRKLDRLPEAEKAVRKALARDRKHARSKRELAKLTNLRAPDPSSQPCPKCGAPAFATDHRCLQCGGNLSQLRVAAEQQAAEQAQREAAKRQAEEAERQAQVAREAAVQFVVNKRAEGTSDEGIATEFLSQDWDPPAIIELLGLPIDTWLIQLPDGTCGLVRDVEGAKRLQERTRIVIKELRVRKRVVNAEIKEVRQLYKATAPGSMGRRASYGRGGLAKVARAIDEAGRFAHQQQVAHHDGQKHDSIQELEHQKLAIDSAVLECERLVLELKEWVGENT